MAEEIDTLFNIWDQYAGKNNPFVYYSYTGGWSQYGFWGATRTTADPGSTKLNALYALTRPAGDANLDGVVDAKDCAILQANFGKTGMYWEQGDFNNDGKVDSSDLALMNANITGGACVAPVATTS